DEIGGVEQLGQDLRHRLADVRGVYYGAVFEAVRAQIVPREPKQRAITIDEDEALGSAELGEDERDGSDASAEVGGERGVAARSGERPEQDGIDMGAIAVPAGGLTEVDAPAEKRVVRAWNLRGHVPSATTPARRSSRAGRLRPCRRPAPASSS